MKSIPLFSIAWLIFLLGCASDPKPQPQPHESPSTKNDVQDALKPSAAPLHLEVEVGYSAGKLERKKTLSYFPSDENRVFRSTEALILPPTIPNSFRLRIGQNELGLSFEKSFVAFGQAAGASSRPVTLEVKASADASGPAHLPSLEVTGLRNLLSDTDDQTAIATIVVQDKAGKRIWLETEFRTSPSRIVFNSIVAQDLEKRAQSIPKMVRVLKSASLRLDLLEVIQIQNPADEIRELVLPLNPSGRVVTQLDTNDLIQRPCDFTLNQGSQDVVLSQNLYLLPLIDGLNRKFISVINEAVIDAAISLTLAPKGEAWVGIFGEGDPVASLTEHGHDKSAFKTVQAIASCRSRCGDTRRDMVGWNEVRARAYWADLGWPGASRACDRLKGVRIPVDASYPDEVAMSQCAQWELSNGTTPWDDHRYCWSPAPGNPWGYTAKEMWIVEKRTTPVEVGVRTYPIFLELKGDANLVKLRRPEADSNDTPVERVLMNLFSERAVLWD